MFIKKTPFNSIIGLMNKSSSSILQLGGVFYARCEESIGTSFQ